MSEENLILGDKSLVIIFTYAAAGLGHLRVTNALYRGLPKNVTPLLLGSQDKSISSIHRFTSIHPWTRGFAEWVQRGMPEDIFTYFYRMYLRGETDLLYRQMLTILDQRIELPKTVLIVATHFGLAHQLAAIKRKIEFKRQVKVVLAVQVTDDSPQHIWYVPGTDLIFVPSDKTRQELINYGKKNHLPELKFIVSAYPVSPELGRFLSDKKYQERIDQTDLHKQTNIKVIIPVSGAAVHLSFFTKLIDLLGQSTRRFQFKIISKNSPYTVNFINQMLLRKNVSLVTSGHDREVVDEYEKIYQKEVISLEITKPSEQTFKALLNPKQVGGSILLFAAPVGRQEYDNLQFLRRHHLIPDVSDSKLLWKLADRGISLKTYDSKHLLHSATGWRGLELPIGSTLTVRFIWWSLQEGIFNQMARFERHVDSNEVSSLGVNFFWQEVNRYLGQSPG